MSTAPLSPSSAETPSTTAGNALGVSVIIPNYNYQEFVGQAIDSALALDWPKIQVIVVDDGSTDQSREVIEAYRGRVTIVHQPNAGQLEAYNVGFMLATEEVIIFLDSDDLLDSAVMQRVATVWRTGISKVQYRMRAIDAAGKPLGNVIPQYQGTPTPEQIRHWAATTTAYPSPPGSGNAYARAYLQQIFPLDDSCGKPGDASCIAAAPYLGDVLTVPVTLGSYRVHGRNDGAASRLDVKQFQLHVVRAQQRHAYAKRMAQRVGIHLKPGAINSSLSYLPYRLASLRLDPQTHPIVGDNVGKLWVDVMQAIFKPQGMSVKGKITIGVWATLVALTPRDTGLKLVLWRFVPAARPKFLRNTLMRFGLVR